MRMFHLVLIMSGILLFNLSNYSSGAETSTTGSIASNSTDAQTNSSTTSNGAGGNDTISTSTAVAINSSTTSNGTEDSNNSSTTTTEPSSANATTVTTTTEATTTYQPTMGCRQFSITDGMTFLPYEEAKITCNCSEVTDGNPYCPNWEIVDGNDDVNIVNDTQQDFSNSSCAVVITITIRNPIRTRRRQFEFVCSNDAGSEYRTLVTLQKSLKDGPCYRDTDCAEEDMICVSEKCVCPKDRPVNVEEAGKCVVGQIFGGSCQYQEECHHLTNNSVCKRGMCQCREGFQFTETGSCENQEKSAANWKTPFSALNFLTTLLGVLFVVQL